MFSFKKQKPFVIGKEKSFNDIDYNYIFTIVSDGSFLSFIINDWGFDPKYYYGKDLKEVNPKLHQDITSHKFLDEFKNQIHQDYISEITHLFNQFSNPKAELEYFNNRLSQFKNSIQKNKQNHNLTSFSKAYILEVSQQLTEVRDSLSIKLSKTITTKLSSIEKTVFGKNFDFLAELFDNLEAKEFIKETETSKNEFITHFYVDNIPKSKINLYASNLADFGLLLKSLKPFFTEDYQNSRFYNNFWSDRFLFYTKSESNNPSKSKDQIIKLLSSKRDPIKRGAISEIVRNLKGLLQ